MDGWMDGWTDGRTDGMEWNGDEQFQCEGSLLFNYLENINTYGEGQFYFSKQSLPL
jgi:hypothetical protein